MDFAENSPKELQIHDIDIISDVGDHKEMLTYIKAARMTW